MIYVTGPSTPSADNCGLHARTTPAPLHRGYVAQFIKISIKVSLNSSSVDSGRIKEPPVASYSSVNLLISQTSEPQNLASVGKRSFIRYFDSRGRSGFIYIVHCSATRCLPTLLAAGGLRKSEQVTEV